MFIVLNSNNNNSSRKHQNFISVCFFYSSFLTFGFRTSFFGDFAVELALLIAASLFEFVDLIQSTGLLRYIGQAGRVNYEKGSRQIENECSDSMTYHSGNQNSEENAVDGQTELLGKITTDEADDLSGEGEKHSS